MPKRKSERIVALSESTVSLLEPARGVSDVRDERIAEVARRLLTLPQDEQIAAAQWMGTQPDYAGVLAYLEAKAGVTGALRRAVKQAMFELRRRGVQVSIPAQGEPPSQEAASVSQAWTVEECFAAAPYLRPRGIVALHLSFFMRHVSGQRAVFAMDATPEGHLLAAHLSERGVDELYEQCVQNPYREQNIPVAKNEFVAVPVEWAVQVAHELRQRTLKEHVPMPAHAAFYWGRLPDPPEQPVPHPVDSISDAEAGWLVTSLVQSEPPVSLPPRVVRFLLPYAPAFDEFVLASNEVMEEQKTQIVLLPQSEEERKRQTVEKLFRKLYPDESVRERLVFMLPILGSIALLAGERDAALWLKALWRELKERTDRPFWRTEAANILVNTAYHRFMGITEEAQEAGENVPQP